MKLGSDGGLPIVEYEGEGWVGKLFGDTERFTPLNQPRAFAGTLREYQKFGFSWLSYLGETGFGCCLADDMGLGKTAQTIAMLLKRKEGGNSKGSSLVLCPTSVVSNWVHEFEKFGPDLKIMVHHGSERRHGKSFRNAAAESDIVISTYAVLNRDILHLQKVAWDGIILDEAQNIKNESTKQSRNSKSLLANYKIALTGTPVENRLSELKSILDFLNPGYLGSTDKFVKEYSIPIEKFNDAERMATLHRMVSPFILRRVKTDKHIISDLPEKNEMKVYCSITKEQAALYENTVADMMRRIEGTSGIERRGIVINAILKLKQILNHPAQFTKDLNLRW
jgi:SNF2 family DNA or RNA helicase